MNHQAFVFPHIFYEGSSVNLLSFCFCDKYKVKVTQWNHFDPEYLSMMMVEADGPQAFRDLLMEGGFMHCCDLRIYPVTSIDDTMMKKMDDVPTIF